MEYGIIMASGLGTRMRPLTDKTPKPLIPLGDVPMIETVLEGLKERQLKEIVIVVGYLGEQFAYLEEKYPNVRIVKNKDYETINNISSVYYARHILEKGDCFICEADLLLTDKSIFQEELKQSCYFGKMVKGFSEDWVFEKDEEGRITRVGKGGTDCYNMVGIAYFKNQDAGILKEAIENAYGRAGYEDMFWDDVVNQNLDKLDLKVHPVLEHQIIEIDTVAELQQVRAMFRGEGERK